MTSFDFESLPLNVPQLASLPSTSRSLDPFNLLSPLPYVLPTPESSRYVRSPWSPLPYVLPIPESPPTSCPFRSPLPRHARSGVPSLASLLPSHAIPRSRVPVPSPFDYYVSPPSPFRLAISNTLPIATSRALSPFTLPSNATHDSVSRSHIQPDISKYRHVRINPLPYSSPQRPSPPNLIYPPTYVIHHRPSLPLSSVVPVTKSLHYPLYCLCQAHPPITAILATYFLKSIHSSVVVL